VSRKLPNVIIGKKGPIVRALFAAKLSSPG
jgi:hypothetical protein